MKKYNIPGFKNYKITKNGKVFSFNPRFPDGKEIKGSLHSTGYWSYKFKISNTEVKTVKRHRLMALTFLLNPLNKLCVNHIDGNKLNDDLSNLEWVTYKENSIHAFKIGLNKGLKGSKNGRSILNENQVLKIRELLQKKIIQWKIAKMFNVSRQTISAINCNDIW